MLYRLCLLWVLVLGCSRTGSLEPSAAAARLQNESVVQCLAREGVHLYGASWCGFCQEQLSLFGGEAANLPYTDCDSGGESAFIETCVEHGVSYGTAIPVWIFADSSRLYGIRDPAVIAAVAGCP